ncbi:MAG: uroporphyrinogen-III synthase [Longimicrobiales bacterium]|nr:uroporphyrinogen-III synthase [Longimicrobiales bacterium]
MKAESALAGVGVAVTRGEGADGPLTLVLKARGARVLDWGSIGFAPPEDLCPFFSALARIWDYDWICFSSPRAVDAVVSRVAAPPEGVRMAAVGPSTAASLEKADWPVHRIPVEGSGEGLVEAFRAAGDAQGARVFFPASAIARDVIPDGLTELGATVDRRTAYRMVTLPLDGAACSASVEADELQVVTFASPSAVIALRAGIGEDLFQRLAGGTPAAAMGPTTAVALREVGWVRRAVAEKPTLEGLADAAEKAATM